MIETFLLSIESFYHNSNKEVNEEEAEKDDNEDKENDNFQIIVVFWLVINISCIHRVPHILYPSFFGLNNQ